MPLTFGVFPLGMAGGPDGLAVGPPDDFDEIGRAVAELQGDGPPLVPRMYVVWTGPGSTEAVHGQVDQLTAGGLPWDLVLCYRDPGGDVAAWESFVAQVVERHGRALGSVQVTGEPNLTWAGEAADGAFPYARDAMVRGVLAAAEAKRRTGATAAIGFAVISNVGPASSDFWPGVRDTGGASFAAALDYAGIDIYPGVFGPPVAIADLADTVEYLLRDFREHDLATAGIPATVPIRICENGWPTGPDRSEEEQAAALETIILAVHRLRAELNVTHWQLFTLRDADSSRDGLFHRFGVLHSDYTRKPAFHTLRRLNSTDDPDADDRRVHGRTGGRVPVAGEIPAARVHDLARALPGLTRGEGQLESRGLVFASFEQVLGSTICQRPFPRLAGLPGARARPAGRRPSRRARSSGWPAFPGARVRPDLPRLPRHVPGARGRGGEPAGAGAGGVSSDGGLTGEAGAGVCRTYGVWYLSQKTTSSKGRRLGCDQRPRSG